MIHTVKGFGIVNKAQVDVFMELSCFFNNPTDVGDLTSGSSAFSKTSSNIWKFMLQVLLKPGLRILSITLLACETSAIVCSLSILWHCLSSLSKPKAASPASPRAAGLGLEKARSRVPRSPRR